MSETSYGPTARAPWGAVAAPLPLREFQVLVDVAESSACLYRPASGPAAEGAEVGTDG